MAEKEINAIVKNVTKTTDEWASATEIPAKGVICVETTTDGDTKIKIGDGVNTFSGLKYLKAGVGVPGTGVNAEIFNDINNNIASGQNSHAEGTKNTALGDNSHIEGLGDNICPSTIMISTPIAQTRSLWETSKFSLAQSDNSHSEGRNCLALGIQSHAEGRESIASGSSSHSEGYSTVASGTYSHAEGNKSEAWGEGSHAEGISQNSIPTTLSRLSDDSDIISSWNSAGFSCAKEMASHTEGYNCLALGGYSHAGGFQSIAQESTSFAHGKDVKANNYAEVAFGKYNQSNTDTLFSIGNGADEDTRSNAFEITKTTGKLFDKEIVVVDNVSNPNLLMNPDFAVNQRGQTSYGSDTSSIYTVDRWKTLHLSTKVDVVSSGLKLGFTSAAAAASVIGQTIEGTSLAGRTVTFSACVAEQTAQHGKLSVNYLSGGERKYNLVDLNKVGVTSITVSIPADATDIRAWIYGADIRVGDTVDSYTTIAWAKLEIGVAATPFVPPDPATELAKCQRYLYVLRGSLLRAGLAEAYSTSYALFYLYAPASFRTVPSVSFENVVLSSTKDGSVYSEAANIQVRGCNANAVKLLVSVTDPLNVGEQYELSHKPDTVGSITLSAEL